MSTEVLLADGDCEPSAEPDEEWLADGGGLPLEEADAVGAADALLELD